MRNLDNIVADILVKMNAEPSIRCTISYNENEHRYTVSLTKNNSTFKVWATLRSSGWGFHGSYAPYEYQFDESFVETFMTYFMRKFEEN